jgi:hypothetical protein
MFHFLAPKSTSERHHNEVKPDTMNFKIQDSWSSGMWRIMNGMTSAGPNNHHKPCSLPYSQEPATGPYSGPDESSPYHSILFLQDPS